MKISELSPAQKKRLEEILFTRGCSEQLAAEAVNGEEYQDRGLFGVLQFVGIMGPASAAGYFKEIKEIT